MIFSEIFVFTHITIENIPEYIFYGVTFSETITTLRLCLQKATGYFYFTMEYNYWVGETPEFNM